MLHLSRILVTALLPVALATAAPTAETIEATAPFGKISAPFSAEVASEVEVTIQTKGVAITAPTDLVVDMHALIGAGQRRTGLGQQRFSLTPGQDEAFTAKFTVPEIDRIARVAFPTFITPAGKGWNEKTAMQGVQVRTYAKGTPPPPPEVKVASKAIVADPLPMNQPPVEVLSSTRAEMVLNGPWLFRPAGTGRAFEQVADDAWGQIWVPGSWGNDTKLTPGLIRTKEGGIWDSCTPDLVSAWYERNVTIPEDWKGRSIILDLARVSTEAIVYADGKECGIVTWPSGQVDITDAVEAGKEATIRIRVFAVETGGMEMVQMGTAEGDFMRQAKLEARGLIGDVVLSSEPRGPALESVFVMPSVKNQELTLRVGVKDAEAGSASFTAKLYDEKGNLEKTFNKEVALDGSELQTVDLTWKWSDPRLWDIGQPNLYTLKLEAKGGGLSDEYAQRFGFREFGIDGRDFVLNGRKVRLRPEMVGVGPHNGGGMREISDNHVRIALENGANYLFIWPANPETRGSLSYTIFDAWFDSADEQGILISAPVPWFSVRSTDRKIKDEITWSQEQREDLKKAVARTIRPHRNHPSIVMWGGSANQFPLHQNQNPRVIGRKNDLHPELRDYSQRNLYSELAKAGNDAIAAIKEVDPTRPVYTHHTSYVGDVANFNTYLGMHQLQEREDWMSFYSEKGDLPFTSHEFGMPLELNFTRGRSGHFANSLGAEPLITEFSAIYQGPAAYTGESPGYRAAIRKDYKPDANQAAPYGKWTPNFQLGKLSPNHMEFNALFARNTWRSWRTYGVTGGLYPWWSGNFSIPKNAGTIGFQKETPNTAVAMPAFQSGRRGPYLPELKEGILYARDTEKGGFKLTPAGKALLENNQPTLAYIGGSKEAFSAKDHHFSPGEMVEKQIIIINDQISPAPAYSATWSAEIDGKRVDGGELTGTIASGETLKLPISFKADGSGPKANGVIKLEATVGAAKHSDEFAFRVYAKPAPGEGNTVAVLDPEGTTSAWLKSLGYTVREWDGSSVPLVVVGRNALSGETKPARQAELESYVRNGGRIIVFTQDYNWVAETLKLRYAPVVSRRAWPAGKDHPVTVGLDGEDLRDWRGAGTGYPEELNTEVVPKTQHQDFGWHWGNRGSVASAIPELPHFSGTRPLVVAEFDLVYSPLMETRVGKGAIIWNSLDLEGRTQADPVAEIVTRRLIDYVATMELPASRPVAYVGKDSGRAILKQLGIPLVPAAAGSDQLIVAGPGATDADLAPFTKSGNPILVIAQDGPKAPFGVTLKNADQFVGSINVPGWPETAGISIPDVRFRTDAPWWILASGCDIGADGLLGRKTVDASTVIYCQLDPAALNVEKQPYFKFTRWRQYRALSNLLANLGADFPTDADLLTAIAGKQPASGKLYYPDYSRDFVSGDNPYRWNTW